MERPGGAFGRSQKTGLGSNGEKSRVLPHVKPSDASKQGLPEWRRKSEVAAELPPEGGHRSAFHRLADG